VNSSQNISNEDDDKTLGLFADAPAAALDSISLATTGHDGEMGVATVDERKIVLNEGTSKATFDIDYPVKKVVRNEASKPSGRLEFPLRKLRTPRALIILSGGTKQLTLVNYFTRLLHGTLIKTKSSCAANLTLQTAVQLVQDCDGKV
ncbi:hypothetical protein CHS0354_029162, partial [Potamilus streckersoni]